MNVFNLFASQMHCKDALAAALQSVARRDRRIAFLKKRLAQTRADAARAIDEKTAIISGLEQALLSHAPVTETPADERIAQLQTQLAAMTALADSFHQRARHASL